MEMDKKAKEALKLLREIKSLAFATVNSGEPAVRIADVMLVDEDGLYFITARGKPYYRQLKETKKIAITGLDENFVSVRIVGDTKFCGDQDILEKIFEHNPILHDLYPDEKRNILEVFHLYRGRGEFFDLSKEPPMRERFAFGGMKVNSPGYRITEDCIACGICIEVCPVDVITQGDIYVIDGNRCLECGACREVCPEDAIGQAEGI